MTNRVRISFPYMGEIFAFLHIGGVLHCSWWWMALFLASDWAEGVVFDKKEKTK